MRSVTPTANNVYKYKGGRMSIPEGTEVIADYCFCNCTDLTAIKIPDSVKHIGRCAFMGCTNLKEVLFPKNCVGIDDNAFCQCRNLEKITLRAPLLDLGEHAFAGCAKLSKETIGKFVVDAGFSISDTVGIPASAFNGCVVNPAKYVVKELSEERIAEYEYRLPEPDAIPLVENTSRKESKEPQYLINELRSIMQKCGETRLEDDDVLRKAGEIAESLPSEIKAERMGRSDLVLAIMFADLYYECYPQIRQGLMIDKLRSIMQENGKTELGDDDVLKEAKKIADWVPAERKLGGSELDVAVDHARFYYKDPYAEQKYMIDSLRDTMRGYGKTELEDEDVLREAAMIVECVPTDWISDFWDASDLVLANEFADWYYTNPRGRQGLKAVADKISLEKKPPIDEKNTEQTLKVVYAEVKDIPEIFFGENKSFRGRSDIRLVIPFNVYLEFCTKQLGEDDCLATKTRKIKEFIRDEDFAELRKCYYKDMAVTIVREFQYAYCNDKKAQVTVIHHEFGETTHFFTKEDIGKDIQRYEEVANEFLTRHTAKTGSHLPLNIKPHDKFMWEYTILLAWYGMSLGSVWDIKF
jgi:hypothetical protein